MQIIKKDITTVTKGIIAHQVNCTNHIGSGVAKAIINKWPIVKTAYHEWCSNYKNLSDMLGKVQLIEVEPGLYVANCFAQLDKGYDGKKYTDYNALADTFHDLVLLSGGNKIQVYVPYRIGCGLAGGDWNVVERIIDVSLPGVIACEI
jgi:O-acetyl-ADP-ribose deacetylase (regulator of RNase III)